VLVCHHRRQSACSANGEVVKSSHAPENDLDLSKICFDLSKKSFDLSKRSFDPLQRSKIFHSFDTTQRQFIAAVPATLSRLMPATAQKTNVEWEEIM
jgi:hypothetical protein